MKKSLFFLSALLLIACNNSSKENNRPENGIIKKARKIHNKVIKMDTHNDFSPTKFTADTNYTQNLNTQVTLPKMKKGGPDVTWLAVYTQQDSLNKKGYETAYEFAMEKFKAIHRLTEDYGPQQIELAYNSDDVRRIHKAGQKIAMIGVENGYPIGEDTSRVKEFYDLGARYMSLAHNGASQLADSNTGENDSTWLYNDGMSDLGKEVLAKMNKYGIIGDVSHPSKGTMKDMLKYSKAPIVASHSNARALSDVSRNLDDEQLKWLKENGGVAQAVAVPQFVDKKKAEKMEKQKQKVYQKQGKEMGFELLSDDEISELSYMDQQDYYAKENEVEDKARALGKIDSLYKQGDPVDVPDFVDQIDYMVDKMGIDHVGISSDFDGGGGVYGWNDASEAFNVTLELVARGYSEDDIAKLWGENFLRVLDKVQETAKEIQEGDS